MEKKTVEYLENTPFDELKVGDSTTLVREVSEKDIELFAYISGDINPLHLNEEYAKTTQFGGRIAHGLFCALMLTTAVATKLPGPGSVYRGQEMKFHRPVRIGDTLTATLVIVEKKKRGHLIKIECAITNQNGETVFSGLSTAIAPTEKLRIEASKLPNVTIG